MEKVVQQKPSAVSLLKVQYRMHETIMQFPSDWFYHGELEAAPEVRYRGILDFDTPMRQELDRYFRDGLSRRFCRRKLRTHQ